MRKKVSFTLDHNTDEGVVNLTPLIDVVFVVLILFILIAPLLELDRIQLAPASNDNKREMTPIQENAPLKIQVFSDNSIYLNNQIVAAVELPFLLKQEKGRNPYAIPQVYLDKNAFFGTYQIVKNATESSGFEEMDVILKPGE